MTATKQHEVERIKIEQNLRESEEKFRATFNQAAVGIAHVSIDGRFQLLNRKLCEITGYTEAELLELTFQDITHPDDLDTDLEYVRQTLANEIDTYSMEKRYIHKEGSLVWINLTVSLVRETNGQPKYFISVIEDISDRKQAELALLESEEKLSLFVRYAPVSVAMFDRNMHYIAVSQSWVDAYNLGSIEAILGRSHYEIFPSLPDRWCQAHQQGLAGNIEKCNEDCYVWPNGGQQWLRWEVHPWGMDTREVGGILIFIENITERKQAELALRQSEEHFRNLADSMPQIVWTANPDGTVDYYNQRVHEFSGFVQNQDRTWQWQPVLHPDDEQHTIEAWLHAVATGEIYECSHRVKRIDGEFRWHLSRGTPVKDELGRIVKWYGTATDIHAQKQYQAEREELLRREQSARIEAESASRMKDEFLATLSHELRTPMNAMLGWTTMLRTRKLNEATITRALETIERNSRTLNQLIEDILDVSGIIRGKVRLNLQPLQLQPVIEQAIETVKPTAEAKNIQILVESLQRNSLKVMGDSSRLQQIVWNLLSNAIKFTPNGGRVEVRLSVVEGTGRAEGAEGDIIPYTLHPTPNMPKFKSLIQVVV